MTVFSTCRHLAEKIEKKIKDGNVNTDSDGDLKIVVTYLDESNTNKGEHANKMYSTYKFKLLDENTANIDLATKGGEYGAKLKITLNNN